MANSLLPYRYVTFVFSIVCGVILCSVAAWDLSLVQAIPAATGLTQVDIALISANALTIVLVFLVLSLDVFGVKSSLGRIWFECLWTSILSLFHLAGAAALTANASTIVCSPQPGTSSPDICTPVKVLMAFSWIQTVSMLVYFCILAVTAVRHSTDDPKVWVGSILDYPWFAVRVSLGSQPSSPNKTQKGETDTKDWRGWLEAKASFARRMLARAERDIEKQLPRRGTPAGRAASRPSQQNASPPASQSPTYPSKPPRRGKGSLGMFRPPPLDLTLATSYGKPQ